MSYVLELINKAGLSPQAFRVLLHLAIHAATTGEAGPSIRSIEETCGMSRHTVIEAIRELERTGWIVTEKQREYLTLYRLFPNLKLVEEQ